MTKTLITGANQGLGYHAAQRLMAVGHEVWVSARDPKSGTEAARTLGARFVRLDVTDDASAAAAAQVVADAGGLDVLINNAGISDRTPVAETTASDVQRLLDTNVLGPVRVIQAFTVLLEASAAPVVVNVSSSVGSLAYASNPQGSYPELNLLAYPAVKGSLEYAHDPMGQSPPTLAGELRRPGFHGHQPQSVQGHSDTRGRYGRHRPIGDRRTGRSDRDLLRSAGHRAMVTSAPVLFRAPPRLQRDGPYQPCHSRVNPDSGVRSPMCGNGGRISRRAEP